MSRDYKSRQSKTSSGSKGSLVLGIFIGYTLGIMSAIGIWFYLENAPSPFLNEEQTSVFDQVFDKTDAKSRVDGTESKAEDTTVTKEEQKTKFDFYDILSSENTDFFDYEAPQQAEKPQQTEKPQAVAKLLPQLQPQIQPQLQPQPQPQPQSPVMISPAPPSAPQHRPGNQGNTENYYLQVGSFRSPVEADHLKARLALLGLIASVQSANLAEKGMWYRVRVGPFTKKVQVDNVHVTLRENGMDAQLIKTR